MLQSARNRRRPSVIAIGQAGEHREFSDEWTWKSRLAGAYDRTGTLTFSRSRILGSDRRSPLLKPDTTYELRASTLAVDGPVPNFGFMADIELT